jgi:hypothetical protein
VVGAAVGEEDLVVAEAGVAEVGVAEVEVAEAGVEVAEAGVEEAVAVNQQQQQQQHQPPTHLGTDSKGYRPPYFEEIPSCSTRSNRNSDYIGLPMSITMT